MIRLRGEVVTQVRFLVLEWIFCGLRADLDKRTSSSYAEEVVLLFVGEGVVYSSVPVAIKLSQFSHGVSTYLLGVPVSGQLSKPVAF